jgi:hypothetical protein
MKIHKYFLIPFLGVNIVSGTASALVVTTTTDGTALVNEIVGTGITTSNISFTGSNVSAGLFTDGLSSGLSMESGILLTSGNAADAVGPNDSDATSTNNGLAGDADLNSLIPGFSTNDATILEFDFTTAGGDLFFNYQFGSEEYNEWVNSSFNDVFGFFLDGVNIALIPGTATAVSINNVNELLNSTYYNNNDPSDLGIPTPFDIEYDGFTTLFTAQALGIGAGTHTIKLAIADAGDFILDSGVFIQAGSFSDTPVSEPSVLALLGLGFLGMVFAKKRRQSRRN